ncbi:MAG: enoyl-CoA hydratase, partial [Sphingomonadaceae bacterium]|nr:enoyl-CoA hydratase [Sphingomonadaceae bacterium]
PRAEALALAEEIAARNPDAIRGIKRLLNASRDAGAEAILLAEAAEQQAVIGSPNQMEAVSAGMAGRAPQFAEAGA